MKIVEIREKTVAISSPIRNAYIDFSKDTRKISGATGNVWRPCDLTGEILETQLQPQSMLVVGNWKMHGRKVENEARLSFLAANLPANTRVSAAVCVPFPYLAQAEAALHASTVGLGVQDISAQSTGAFTGEVSAAMAADFGCGYAIIGHSERRSHHAESSSLIAAKAARATDHGLIPIVCVGETLEEREAGRTETVVTTQVIEILDLLVDASPENLVIAYEPLWAIGTGKSASGAEAQEVHACIRASLRERVRGLSGVRILYGGSVKASTAVDLFRQPDIDGALVGGASLDAAEFVQIWLAADCARRVEEHRSAVSSPAKDTQIAGSLHSPTDRR